MDVWQSAGPVRNTLSATNTARFEKTFTSESFTSTTIGGGSPKFFDRVSRWNVNF